MFEILAFGFSQGFVIGPVSLLAIHEGLQAKKHGFEKHMQVILGSTVVDVVFVLLATVGVAQIIDNPAVRLIMFTIAAYMLIVMGLNTLFLKKKKMSFHHMHLRRLRFFETDFMEGLLINLVNPLAIVFWIIVAGSLYADFQYMNPVWFALLISGGALASCTIVALLTQIVKKILHGKMIRWLNSISSVILIGYGIWFFSKATFEFMEVVFR